MTLDPMRLTSPITEEWLVWKDKLLKALDCQGINTRSLRYTFTERLLAGDTKANFDQAVLDISICTVDNFNKVQAEIIKHAIPACDFQEQRSICVVIQLELGA